MKKVAMVMAVMVLALAFSQSAMAAPTQGWSMAAGRAHSDNPFAKFLGLFGAIWGNGPGGSNHGAIWGPGGGSNHGAIWGPGGGSNHGAIWGPGGGSNHGAIWGGRDSASTDGAIWGCPGGRC